MRRGRRFSSWPAACVALAGAFALACATGEAEPLPTVPPGTDLYSTVHSGRLERVVDPEFHMASALRRYEAGLRQAAADEVEKLAAFVAYERERAGGERRRQLAAAHGELGTLERDLRRGEVDGAVELDRVFSQTRAALLGPAR